MNSKSNTTQNSFKELLYIWVPFLIGLSVLFVPSYIELSNTVWQTDAQGQGPLVLLIVVFLFWTKRFSFLSISPSSVDSVLGVVILIISVVFYFIGNLLQINTIEIFSHILFLIGGFLFIGGRLLLIRLWFPVFFLIFMVPLPGFVVDGITMPMKIAVSNVAEYILYQFDLPIARDGVILQIGYYKLLVADACAGLHTLISLEAIGLLYLYLIKSPSVFRNVILAILVVPIAFIANVIRVITLVLVTYYIGDEVGQGFIHDFSGFILFMAALLLIILVDSLLRFISKKWK